MTDDGYKEATGNTWKPEKKGDFVEGLLVKVEENVGSHNSMMYHIEQLKGGEMVKVWGTAILNSRMSEVKIGQQVKITYEGVADKGSKGKQPSKIFTVLYKDVNLNDIKTAMDEFDIPDQTKI